MAASTLTIPACDTATEKNPGDSVSHYACHCRTNITLCGTYTPWVCDIYWAETGKSGDCEECMQVWFAQGCGVCGCASNRLCEEGQQHFDGRQQ